MKNKVKKVVLAYSGGLDTSIIVSWLIENYGCEVITYTGDVGQAEELDGVPAKAKRSGAIKAVVEDLTDEFIAQYCWPALRAGAIYEGRYLLGTSLARPILALGQVRAALAEGADAVCHGCTGKGNDQLRFELTYRALAPDLTVIAPWREWDINSREDALEYAEKHGIPVPVSKENLWSRDRNIWHISHEGGLLEDPWNAPPKDLFQLTVDPADAPNNPQEITVGFQGGLPVSVDGVTADPRSLLTKLNNIGGKHGVGRIDIVENRVVGLKSRGVYETPGGTILNTALRDLESITLDALALRERMRAGEVYADLAYRGEWFTPTRDALDALVRSIMAPVTGEVRLTLYKGRCMAVARRSPKSLYNIGLSSFANGKGYDQADAGGFIRLKGLPLEAELRRNAKQQALAAPKGLLPDVAVPEPVPSAQSAGNKKAHKKRGMVG